MRKMIVVSGVVLAAALLGGCAGNGLAGGSLLPTAPQSLTQHAGHHAGIHHANIVNGPSPGVIVNGPTPGVIVNGPTPGVVVNGPTPGVVLNGPTPGVIVNGPTPGQ